MQHVLGVTHPDVVSEGVNFAVVLVRSGQTADGLELLLQLQNTVEAVLGAQSPRTADVNALIAHLTGATG